MKPRPGRDVEVHVRVVHPVHTPERRHRVKHQVHQIHREVERQQRPQECQRVRDGKHIEETRAALLGKYGHAHRSRREKHTDQEDVDNGD